MAGIGFELKKIFQEKSVARTVVGSLYSTTVVLGPTLIIVILLIALYLGLGFFGVPYYERELLSSTILYIFVFSVLFTSPFNAVFSRYIADKIYDETYEDILPSYYVCLLLSVGTAALFGIPFCAALLWAGKVQALYVLLAYISFLSMVLVLISMIYLHVTKEYRTITLYFVVGALAAVATALVALHVFHASVVYSIIWAMAVGLLLIGALQFAYIRRFFNCYSNRYKECLGYLWRFRQLLFCNLLYTLGLYVHNFVFWHSEGNLVVVNCFYSNPAYDMATFLAVFTNLSLMVLFTVMVETRFHEKYQAFTEAVYGSTLDEIHVLKRSMFRLLAHQQNYMIGIQAIITITLFIVAVVVLPTLGFGSLVLTIYAALCVAYFVMLVMYNNIVVLYYFSDYWGAMATAGIFCATVFVGTLFSRMLPPTLYGLGALVGALAGWSFSFFRIRYLNKHFDEHIFCNTAILGTSRERKPVNIVYRRDSTFSDSVAPVDNAVES